MTTFLGRNRVDLAISAVMAPLASYGLHRMFPAPDAAFLAVATTVGICAQTICRDWGSQYAKKLTKQYGYVDHRDETITYFIFYNLNKILATATSFLIPIFARAIGQRMGFQVPGYLQTVAYFNLAGSASWTSKNIFEILRDAYYSKPEQRDTPL